ncbi:efflux RND transporter permease subunit [Salisediminibacterium halotolerans]|uniref:Multidrug efflux pump subunit AcrB n=1 Tax=Salisediminibacterium halotolerans TaxID=517425 RepID=A0A1H9SKF3_9BACI|nr:efflux RND transporter permease subunit [Salisediminibacterium haloalkalitolerans]SER85441.1 Multidrug efflux pump subunit AcrB [Salisediminibacterium haloalkalitolerans]
MLDTVIKWPKITLMFIFILVVLGVLTLLQLPQREVPEFSADIASVSTPYPGGSPEEVEQQITIPIEEAIDGVDGIAEVDSVSTSGFSNVVIELTDGVDRTNVLNELQQEIDAAERDFPATAGEADLGEQQTIGALSSYHILAEDRDDLYEAREMMEDWQSDIESIPQVDSVDIKGFPDQTFLIDADADELFDAGFQVPDIIEAVEEELNTQPLGIKETNGENVQLSLSTLDELDDISSIFIGKDEEDEAVYLEDIAEVGPVHETPEDLITFEGTPALTFTIFQEEGANIPQVGRETHERMEELAAEELPAELTMERFYTQETIVDEIFGDLSFSFSLAVLSVIVVTLLGLNVSSAVIVALAIPTSVLIGLIPLPFFNVDLNQISIIGIIIALGILVDDGIVVGDNIRHKYRTGAAPLDGAIQGSREVRTSIITSTLTIVVTFLPLVFITGSNGDFIRALPTVLITTILASTIVALTLVPIFLIWRQKKRVRTKKKSRSAPKDGLFGKQFDRLSDWYSDTVLRKVVKRPWKIAIIGFILTSALYALIPFIPVEFFPSTDRDEVTLEIRMPAGTTIDETENTLEEMKDYLLERDEHIYETALYAGDGLPPLFGDGISNGGEETGNLLLRVDREEQSAEETIDRWTDELQEEFGYAEPELTTIEAGPPVGAPIAVTLQGPDVDQLIEMSNELTEDVQDLPDSGTVRDDMGPLRPTIVYEPVREELEDSGITMSEISEQISLRTEGIPLLTFRTAQEAIDLEMTLDQVTDGEEIDLEEIELPADQSGEPDGPPELVSLDELVDPEETEEIPQILREDGERTITVRVFPGTEDDGQLEEDVEALAASMDNDAGEDYTVTAGGETEQRTDFIIELATLFILVLFLIYIIMAIQFYSLTLPLLVMSTVHIAGAGAVTGLFITQTGLGFMALMGIVSLAGIVVRNSIVLLEFIKQRRKAGYSVEDAVIEAGRVRLRPILLTAFTAIGALTPVALSGDVLFVPLSISIISGLLFSALITVIIVPAVYTAFALKFGSKE